MRISPTPRVCSGLLCGLLILIAGCGSPSSQNLASLTVTATPSSVPVGGAAILKAVAHLTDGTTQDVTSGTQWTLSNSALATLSNGALTAKAVGAVTVQAAYVEATPAGTSPASATVTPQNLTASVQVTITSASGGGPGFIVPTISWTAPAAIAYGTALSSTQLSATANVAGTFAYTPAAGTVLKVGTQTLSATFTPTDTKNYSAATASVQLSVNKAAPSITWATPAPITAGTALSATQLDATASIAGSFMYSPVAGTVLAAGTQQLTAVFSPTDTTDYSSATAHASLTVTSTSPSNPAPPGGPIGGPVGPAPVGCGGPTINVNSSMSQSALQSAISNAPNCSLILFAAGTYNITSALSLKCSLTYTGPVASPATAEITTSTPNIQLMNMYGGCTTGTTAIEYLQFNGAGPLYLDPSNYSNIVFSHNQVGGLPAEESCGGACEALSLDGNNNNTYTNITIEYNTFGDSNSCTAGLNVDDGGCAGILVSPSFVTNLVIRYNTIQHVLEGIHFTDVNYVVGNKTAQCDGCDIEYNYFNQIHRIALEFQTNVINHQAIMSNNVFGNPLNPYYNTLTLSAPCCQYSNTFGNPSNVVPSNQLTNNVEINTLSSSNASPYGFEMAGNGTNANNNIIQGSFCNGFVWSFGADGWTIQNNTIQGSQMASGGTCPTSAIPSNPISAESGGTYAPVLSGNVMGATPVAIPSVAPTISPASGSQSFPLTITLSDPGYTSGSQPLGNTGIWYTTDGSTPVPGTGTAQYLGSGGTFVLPAAATVKAVGMWGTWNQPTSYPAGYGFMPSGVVTAGYSVSGAIKQPAGGGSSANSPSGKLAVAGAATAELPGGSASAALKSVAITPSQPVVAIGSTTQLKAIATFDDGSVKDVSADFGWQSSDPRTITANASGSLGGLASGPAVISGSYQGHQASVAASSAIGELDWSGPIVISEGGTYSGNWQSTDAKTAAVTVATTAPVIIENAHIRSVSNLIKTSVAGSNVTVRNSLAVALNAAVKGQANGNFLEVNSPARLDVENNYIENARGGVIVHGYAGNRDGQQTIVIRANRARNMNGLLSDGNGGYLPGEGANRSQARFIQFDSVQSVPGIDVGWNEVINYPGHSLVEDNIDVYRSSGTPNQPIEIHDTYIQGAYPYKVAQDAYTGGGIKTAGSPDDNAQDASAFNSIHDNQVIGTVNYGIKFAAGHDNVAANNRVISSGLLADGTKIAAQQVGMADVDASGAGVANGSMYNNTMRDNLIGWTCWQSSCAQQGYRKDQFFPAAPADYSTNSVVAARPITLDMQNNEYQVWLNKMASAGIAVGPSF